MAIDAARPLALVTGAARGIGAEVARQLAEAGYAVVVTAREESAARSHAEALVAEGHDATALALDVGDADSVAALVDAVGFRPLRVLVNNAAAFADARVVMDTNLFGAWRLVQALLPALVRAGSARIVNVGSGSGSHGDPRFGLSTSPASASHAVSKAALHALTVKLAAELRTTGVLVNTVDPGLTATAPGMEAMGARPVADGARSVVAAALLPDDGPTGTFTRDGEPLPW